MEYKAWKGVTLICGPLVVYYTLVWWNVLPLDRGLAASIYGLCFIAALAWAWSGKADLSRPRNKQW